MDGDARRRTSTRRTSVGAAILVAVLALAVTIGVGVWRSASRPVETVEPTQSTSTVTDTPISSAERAELYVHVGGAVHTPGLYVLAGGARVVDAITAAGGLLDDAEATAVNLARELADGEQLIVPKVGEAPPAASPGESGTSASAVNLNTADLAALDTLPGIGPALAGRIIDWREENGGFRTVEDLLAVSGIGASVLANVRDLVTV